MVNGPGLLGLASGVYTVGSSVMLIILTLPCHLLEANHSGILYSRPTLSKRQTSTNNCTNGHEKEKLAEWVTSI